MARIIVVCILISFYLNGYGTHNRAGEISFRHIDGYTYEFTISTYTYSKSVVDRIYLPIFWGDGTYQEIDRDSVAPMGNDYIYNVYKATHTYPGPGVYVVLMEDPNRNLGVKNIPNSVNIIFSVKTTILIGTTTNANNAPVLLNPPVDKAAKDHVFIHNPGAFDIDGDSITYVLGSCTGESGVPIDSYVLPPASDTLYLDPVSGNLIWDTPTDTGIYNIAINVEEWRNGLKISRISRDMQINVYETDNNPPVNGPLNDFCLLAGDSIYFEFNTTDADGDPLTVTATGGPFEVSNPAVFKEVGGGNVGQTLYKTNSFKWGTNCNHARKQPYQVLIKSEDYVGNGISLVDIDNFNIQVIHKAPTGLQLRPGVDSIQLTWNRNTCGSPTGYNIYRKIGAVNYVPDSCEYGVPQSTGYVKIGSTGEGSDTVFTDNNNGLGLVPGYDYCYMVTSVYIDGAESQASQEACATLIAGIPAILRVSVEEHDEDLGVIELAWAMPKDLDTIDDGPYRYDITRISPEGKEEDIAEILSTDLSDTTYSDENINTLIYPYYYSVKLKYEDGGTWYTVAGHEIASSTYLDLIPADNEVTIQVKKRAPWLNRSIDYYQSTTGENGLYNLIHTDSLSIYTDTGLPNGEEHYYRVTTQSMRPINDVEYNTVNNSHINSEIPLDTVPPCPPPLTVHSICESEYNQLEWFAKPGCDDDEIVDFKIYYKQHIDDDFSVIDTITDPNAISYEHYPTERLAGCYAVTATDSFNNESAIVPVCVDSCVYFSLPNAFSPNNDGVHDFFRSKNLGGFIRYVDMKIFNRYGMLVYSTNDPYINWNGRNKDTGELVATGVFYYICDVYEPRIKGTQIVTLTGFIHAFSGDDNPITLPE
ncbi:MAG: gliding motility-associated C-terminal domain-containing protein [Bacteroidales bacterium]|nr:gliding motility-associated C-terminal domain-containing protein [Bacteroidales bacterium]